MITSETTIRCANCNRILSEQEHPCPGCGSEKRSTSVIVIAGVATAEAKGLPPTISTTRTKEFYEINRKIKHLVLFFYGISQVASPIVGFFLGGWLGVVIGIIVGLVSGALAYYLTPHAVTKVREIRTTESG